MHRREVLRLLGATAALPFIPDSAEAAVRFGESLHARLAERSVFPGELRTLNAKQGALVTMIAEMIIPKTDTPGATDVRVTEFIDLLLTDWYTEKERKRLLAGLGAIDARARREGGRSFVDLSEDKRVQLIRALDAARPPAFKDAATMRDRDEAAAMDADVAAATFARLKVLTVYGYFTSERVQKEILKTQMFFPRYDGCVAV
jgi:hypothetical protein